MSLIKLLNTTMEMKCENLSIEETAFLKLKIFMHVCNELSELIRKEHINYFRLMKFNTVMEEKMIEEILLRHIINDILATEEYSLIGIANYTQSSEDIIYEIAMGSNKNPSIMLCRKIIELHHSVRPNLYAEIIKKLSLNFRGD